MLLRLFWVSAYTHTLMLNLSLRKVGHPMVNSRGNDVVTLTLFSYTYDLSFSLGDSAGGNLVSSITLKTITHNIRIPDALFLSYAALLIQFYPSPSRLLCLLDPLLMSGILIRCLNAYQDPDYLKTCPRSFDQELDQAKAVNDIFLSPLLAEKDLLKYFPRTEIIVSDLDPCLDENIQFSSNLSDAGVDVKTEVVPGLPHGFLAFSQLSTECQLGVDQATRTLEKLVKAI